MKRYNRRTMIRSSSVAAAAMAMPGKTWAQAVIASGRAAGRKIEPPIFQVDTAEGVWSVRSASQAIDRVTSTLNGENVFAGASLVKGKYRKTAGGLDVCAELKLTGNRWIELSVSATNTSAKPLSIHSFVPLSLDCANLLTGSHAEDIRMMWESATYEVGRAADHESFYYAALYSDRDRLGPAWMMTYRPPQLWTSMIKKEGSSLTAFVNFRERPLAVDPGETIAFDSILLSAEFNALEGWQAVGRLYTPPRISSKPTSVSGFNTWDFFRGEISTSQLTPVLDSLDKFNQRYPAKLHSFTLDDGWFAQRGSWEFDLKKFPQGEKGWAEIVRAHGMEPGVWISPFWSNKEMVDKFQMTVREEVPNHVIRYRVDPSDPNVGRYVFERFRELRSSGYKYFKIDFLALAYTDKPYKYSKFHPERVIREFLIEIKKAVGEDAFLLGCGSVMAPCAMVCDGARIMADITENWNVVKGIYLRIAYRYWMNGSLFLTDPDFFVGRGPETLRPGASAGYALEKGDREYQGFSYIQAKTWATMIFALGGHVNWADLPSGVKPEIWDLAATLAKCGPGKPGVPLDLMDTEQPTKWVRRSNGRLFVVLINTSAEPATVNVAVGEVPQLARSANLVDLFTKERVTHKGGSLQVRLNPYDSRCLLVG